MAVKFDNYVVTLGFMVAPTDEGGLGLKGNEATVFAMIYGFSQNGTSWYEGTQRYIAEWCGASVRGIQKNLDSLIAKEYIEKKSVDINGVTLVRYRVTDKVLQSSYPTNKVRTPHEQSSHNNTIHNIPPYKDSNESLYPPKRGKQSFVAPQLEDIIAYCVDHDFGLDPYEFFDHYQANGWTVGKAKMKDWVATLRNWERRRIKGERS